ncbi:ribosomal protein L1-like protein [Phlyctochytrium arcticum]|nr:ribosomal protein L1-like protein [Phlyctochytrium arcticum]
MQRTSIAQLFSRCELAPALRVHRQTTYVSTRIPSITIPCRAYDRKRYLKEKKLLKASENQEDITVEEALDTLRKYCLAEDKTLVAHIQTMRQEGAKPMRGDVMLPEKLTTEDSSVILAFATGEHAEQAKALGAQIVGGEELIEQIQAGKLHFDRVICTRDMFPHVVKIAKILGPKGLMPSPAKGTVSNDVAELMKSMHASSKFEADEDGCVHMDIAKSSWPNNVILANLKALTASMGALRPSKVEVNKFFEDFSMSAQYTPGIKLPAKSLKSLRA